jgi:hypothetical protein
MTATFSEESLTLASHTTKQKDAAMLGIEKQTFRRRALRPRTEHRIRIHIQGNQQSRDTKTMNKDGCEVWGV